MFSLRSLFVAVAFAGLVCAALVYRTPFLSSAVFTLSLVVAVGATIAAWRSVAGRPFYGAMATALGLYLLVLSYEPLEKAECLLVTNQLIFRAWAEVTTFTPIFVPDQELWCYWQEVFFRNDLDFFEKMGLRRVMYELKAFYYTIHSAVALLLGLLAGWITVWVERRRSSDT